MADKTTNLGMNLPLDSEIVDQELYNENFEILDTEVAKRITAVNGVEAGPDGGVVVNEVPFAKQIASEKQQQSSGEYTFRTTGGEASLEDGPATLVGIYGRSVHTGVINEVFNMTVTPALRPTPSEGEEPEEPITATIDKATFIAYVMDPASITVNLVYTDMWSANPSLYGINVVGTPISGDTITVVYVRPDRGTITPSDPTKFISTGWNLYNNDTGYARVKKYSGQYNFIVGGAYSSLKFSATYDGARQDISVSSRRFSIPSDGYVWVTGGNATTTCIYMTWSGWTSGYEGEWKAYEESVVDFSEDAETAFPYRMCQVGSISDEIDFSMKRMIRRIERVAYSTSTIETLISSGTAYDADENYIYYVLGTPVVTECTVSNVYTANDHGLEMVDGDIAPLILTMYGENLVEKLSSDVLTISRQTLSDSQQAQARMNIGVSGKIIPVISGTTNNSGYAISSGEYFEANGVLYKATASIPKNNAWSSSATAQGDTVHGALNDGLAELNSKMPYYGSLRQITNCLLISALNSSVNNTGIVTSSSQYAPSDLVSGIREVFYISLTDISIVIHGVDNTGVYAEWYRHYNGTAWTDWSKNATTIDITNVELSPYKEWSSNISIHAVKIGHLVHVNGWVLLNAIEYNSTRPCLVISGAIPFYDNSYVFDNEGNIYILKKATTRAELYFNETTTISAQKYVFFNFTYIV